MLGSSSLVRSLFMGLRVPNGLLTDFSLEKGGSKSSAVLPPIDPYIRGHVGEDGVDGSKRELLLVPSNQMDGTGGYWLKSRLPRCPERW